MIVVRDIEKWSGNGLVATIGFFDGVHRGHRFLIDEMRKVAQSRGLPSAAGIPCTRGIAEPATSQSGTGRPGRPDRPAPPAPRGRPARNELIGVSLSVLHLLKASRGAEQHGPKISRHGLRFP